MKYFICNIHWNNRGDEAAVRSMIDSIYTKDLHAEITVVCNGIKKAEQLTKYYPHQNVQVLPEYPSRRHFIELVLPYITKGKVIIGSLARSYCQHMLESDIVVHGPGGPSIGEIYKISESRYLVTLALAQRFGKKVFFYAPSAGPFYDKVRNIIRKNIYKKAVGITVREEQSAKYLRSIGITNVSVTADSALQSTIDHDRYEEEYLKLGNIVDFIGDGSRVIGLTATDLQWHSEYRNNPDLKETIDNTFIQFLRYLSLNSYKAVFIPQKFDCPNPDYTYMCYLKQTANVDNVLVLPDSFCSYMQQFIISKLHLVVGMRYHSNIFAYKMKTPFISIAYEHKMTGFMKLAGLSDNCIKVQDLTAEKLVLLFDKVIQNYAYEQRKLAAHHEEIVKRSQMSTELLFKALQQ